MNPEVKKNWIEALLSGEYTQGIGALRTDNDQFCCLGVLCDLAEKAGIVQAHRYWPANGWIYESVANEKDRGDSSLPHAVMVWAGIDQDRGDEVAVFWQNFRYLSTANDSGVTFSEIAAVIEEKL